MNRRGRPRKVAILVHNPRGEKVVADITLFLTEVMSLLHARVAMFQSTIEEAMHSRLRHEAERMKEIEARLGELSKMYNEFLDLQKEAADRKKRMEVLAGLVGLHDFRPPSGQEYYHKNVIEYLRENAEELRAQLPLWQAMREYLRYVPEARIGEMEEFFQKMQYGEGNRQAIESALKRHPKVFQTRKVKGQKYIALKK